MTKFKSLNSIKFLEEHFKLKCESYRAMAGTIKSCLLDTQAPLSKGGILACILIIFLAAYILEPRFWEPGDESLKNWVSARIFRETGGFPVIHHAPLYNLYLQIFLFFDYPLSIQLEHLTTHLFTYSSIFLLVRRFMPTAPALFLACSWIPMLSVMEGGARVAGIGFLALYFRTSEKSIFNNGYFPLSLGAAALLDTAFISFLLGHVVGTIFVRRSKKELIISRSYFLSKRCIASTAIKSAFILLVLLTIFFQSNRPDNNAHAFNYPWVPFPQSNAFTTSVMFAGNWTYVRQNIPKSEWIYQDWYFIHEKAFGGAVNIAQAVLNNPTLVFKNILSNIPLAVMTPLNFFFGFSFPHNYTGMFLLFLSWLIMPIIIYRSFQYFYSNNLCAHIYSMAFGTIALIGALFLVYFHPRYDIALLPVGVVMAAHFGTSLQFLMTPPPYLHTRRFDASGDQIRSIMHKAILISGILFIIVGSLTNKWVISILFFKDGAVASQSSGIPVWFLNLLLICVGILLIIRPYFFLSKIDQLKKWRYTNTQTLFTNTVNILMAGCIMVYSMQAFSGNITLEKLQKNPFLLSGRMGNVHQPLFASIDKTTKVLALEEPWIRSFANIDIDKVFHALYLPPFPDTSGATKKFLESLDVIWVSNIWSTPAHSMGTQIYLRYKLHVEPFLEKALKSGWTVQEVEGFGKIYRRPIAGKIALQFHNSWKKGSI